MHTKFCFIAGVLFAALLPFSQAADKKEEKITFEQHIFPIFENKCLNCHNPDEAKGGLDLSTYGAMLSGGSGGKVVEPEDPGSSRIHALMSHKEEPFMPPNKPKAPDAELALIAKWIEGGILETSSSKARKSDKPKMDMSLITSTGKPSGPAAMPEHVILQPEVVTDRPNAVPALAHSPWAPIVAIAGQKQVILYHSENFEVLGILPYPEGFPQSLSFSSSGAILQAGGGRGGKAGNVVAWDVRTGERVFEVGREYDIVLGSDISPDHRRVVMGGPGKVFKIWDTVAGEQITAVKKHPDWMLTADYSPDGVLLATGGRNSGLYVWEAETGLEFYTLKGHTKAITDLAWRPDSNVLASISEDGQAILWEMNEGKQVKKWAAHSGGGAAIDFSPDGLMIATVGRDKTLKLWKGDGAALRTIPASTDIVMSVAFTDDSKRVITGDFNGVIKVWNVADGKEIALLDANPPTIDQRIAYAETKIGELNSKIPQLEKSIAAVKAEITQAKARLTEVSTKSGELGGKKAAMDKELATLNAKLKALTDQRAKAQGMVSQNTNLMNKRVAELAAAKKSMQAVQAETNKWTAELAKRTALVTAALNDVNATKKAMVTPVFTDPIKEKAYVAVRDAANAARDAKMAADANVAAKQKALDAVNAQLAAQRKSLADLGALLPRAKTALDNAQNQFNGANQGKAAADAKVAAASQNGQKPGPDLIKAQQVAVQNLTNATNALNAAKAAYADTQAKIKSTEALVAKTAAGVKAPTDQLAAARADQTAKNMAFQKADTALKPFVAAGGPIIAKITKANAELPAKVAAHQKAVADQKHHLNLLNQSKTKLAQITAQVKSAEAAEMSARGAMNNANTMMATTTKELSTTGAKLNTTKAELTKVAQALDVTNKQKEAQTKAVAAIATKEAQAKQSMELVKADLERSQYLAQKFKAAAINYKAKLESEELDDMADDLDGMLEDETEAKAEHKQATEARVAAEKTLAEAKKKVIDGTQKLAETTSSVLERAVALIASRASAELREDLIEENKTAKPEESEVEGSISLAEVTTVEDPVLLNEVSEREEVSEVLSSTLGEKTPEQINSEISAIQKRLEELTSSIAQSYAEADKTRETVDQFSDVAAKTPAVIAERSKVEQSKAESLKSKEAVRKSQEVTVEKQKQLISELKKKYIETLPKPKE